MLKITPSLILNRATSFFLLIIPMSLLNAIVAFVLIPVFNFLYYKLGVDIDGTDRILFFGLACARMIGGLGFGFFYMIPKYFNKTNVDAIVYWGSKRSINPMFKRLCVAGIIIAVCVGIGWSGLYELLLMILVDQIRIGR